MAGESARTVEGGATSPNELARQIRDLRDGYHADPESSEGQEAWNLMAHLVAKEGDTLLTALDAMEPGARLVSPGNILIPTNAAEAVGMWLIGERWVRDHAPERLRAPSPEASVSARAYGEG